MANLLIPRREIWTQQPSLLCDVDPSNQFGINAGFISTANSKQRNIFGGNLLSEVLSGTFSPVVTDQGVVSRWAEMLPGFGRMVLVKTGSPNSRNFTFLTRVRYNTTVPTIVARSGTLGDTNNLIPLWRNAGAFDMRVGGTDYVADGTFAVGQFYDIAISSSSAGCVMYVNGSAVINGGVAASATIDADLAIGDVAGGNNLSDGAFDIVYALFSPRPLSKADVNRFRANPWQIFAPQSRSLFVPVGGGGSVNANASGALSAVAVTAPSASASGSASATGACAAITITAPTATASGSASAPGALAAITVSPTTGQATGAASASGSLPTITLTPATGTATGTSAGGAIASGDFAPITVSQPAGTASGTAVAQGGMPPITLSPFAGVGVAINPSSAVAVGAFAGLNISPFYGIGLVPADFSWEAALPLSPTGVWQSNAASPATVWTPAPKFHV